MEETSVVTGRGEIAWPWSCCFSAYLLPFLLSCGDHFNPDGTSHGGPQDSDRVSVCLGEAWAESPRSQWKGRQFLGPSSEIPFSESLLPSLYFVPFRSIY